MVDAPPCCMNVDRSGENAFDHAVGLWANRAVRPGMPAPHPAPSGRKGPHPRAASGDGHGAVRIGAQDGRPQGPQPRERIRCGVPVAIPRADGDDRDPGPDPGLQGRVLVRGTVVGDLEHIHRAQLRTGLQQGLLGGWFEIAEQQQRQPRSADQQGHARVVRAVRRRALGRRPEHLPLQRPGPPPLPRRRRDHRHTGGRRGPPDGLRLPGRLRQGGGLNHTHGPAPQHPGQAAHVIGVKVRQQEQRHPAHPQDAQAVVHRSRFRARVDHQGRARADGEHRGITLAHGALDVAPVGRRPAGEATGELRRPQHGEEQQQGHRGAGPLPAAEPAPEAHHGQRGGGQQQAPGDPAGPGQLRAPKPRPGARHGGDPPGRHPRAPGEQPRRRHAERRRREGREAEHGRRTRRELRQQVARHRHEAHPGGDHRDDRRAHRLGGRGGPQRLGEAGPHPAPPEGLAPPGPEGQEGPGGQDGEQEAVAPGQPGLVQHEAQHGGGQRGDQGPAPPGREGQQGDRPAGGGPQHARLRPAHHHERQRQGRAAQGRRPQGEPEPGCQPTPLRVLGGGRGPDEQEQDHGQVGARHGQQVQQVGRPERLVQVGRDP